jgi:hypothetical protein
MLPSLFLPDHCLASFHLLIDYFINGSAISNRFGVAAL